MSFLKSDTLLNGFAVSDLEKKFFPPGTLLLLVSEAWAAPWGVQGGHVLPPFRSRDARINATHPPLFFGGAAPDLMAFIVEKFSMLRCRYVQRISVGMPQDQTSR